ncbi:hypothetical protein [Phenylobacterium sp.]|uniref:hypothetical protein n=1 Tax=Phenylobacterium sp. TaxID=1871053 RepID=UPI0035B0AA7F
MGYSVAWIAVKGVTPEALMETLGLEPAGSVRRNQAHVGALAGGWALYVDDNIERAFGQPLERLVALGAMTLAAREEDHVMYCEARGYEGGRETWRVVRDSSEEPYMHVAVTGQPPPQFEEIRANAFAEQVAEGGEEAGVDMIFDIPLELSRSLCGYRPDLEDGPELTPTRAIGQAKGGGFFARLFGKG